MKTEDISPTLISFGSLVETVEDPKCMPRPGDLDWVDPNAIPLSEVQNLVCELMGNRGCGSPDCYRSNIYDYDLDNRDWEVLFARLGMAFAFSAYAVKRRA